MSQTPQNTPAPGIPYFTPQHKISPGTPLDITAQTPTLFKPLKIRGATLRNRIIVSPMCQYSSAPSGPQIGCLTPYHIATLGHYALKGAALVFIEATGVQPNGRDTPNGTGLWTDAQIEGVRAVADFVHSQGALCGLQLGHTGRKGSTQPPFIAALSGKVGLKAGAEIGGWPDDVVAPSGGKEMVWDGVGERYFPPRELTIGEIGEVVRDWAKAAERTVRAGVDVIEIHGAHGYLIHEFLSPVTNRRRDRYGGSWENRVRFCVEIVEAIRAVIPETMPLFLRLSATEWLEETEVGKEFGTWTVDDTVRLSKIVSDLGVDLLDVSSGGNHPEQSIHTIESKDYQIKFAAQIRRELRTAGKPMLIGAVGLITESARARDIVEDGSVSTKQEAETAKKMTESNGSIEPMADVIFVARQFMREPEWVFKVAQELGVDVAWPIQFFKIRLPDVKR